MSVTLIPAGANLVEEVARRIEEAGDPADALVIFPGKRPAHFLRQRLARKKAASFVPPRILSMDELVDGIFEERDAGRGRVRPKAEPIDAVAILYDIQVASPDPVGGSAFMNLDSFFPLGLKIQGDLEELLIEGVRTEDVAGVQPLVDEEVPLRARQRLRTLSHFYEEFYRDLGGRDLSTRSSRYVEVSTALDPREVPGTGPDPLRRIFHADPGRTGNLRHVLTVAVGPADLPGRAGNAQTNRGVGAAALPRFRGRRHGFPPAPTHTGRCSP